MKHKTPTAVCDFETRSACNLRTTGTWRYSIDPTTDILCLAFRLPFWESGRTGLWHPAFPALDIPEPDDYSDVAELVEWIQQGHLVEAHNAWFERCLWQNVLTPRYGWPPVPLQQWRCSAAKASAHALPRHLDDAGAALHLTTRKDTEGSKVMMKVSKPRKSRKAEREQWAKDGITPPAVLWHESRELFERLWVYCRQDVLAEEAVSEALDDLTPHETKVFLMDGAVNERGFQLDPDAVITALSLIDSETRILNTELATVTNGYIDKATQRDRMKVWFESEGLQLFDTQASTLDETLKRTDLTPNARRGVELMRALGRSSTAKYQRMQDWAGADWRVRGGLLYHGASTGRWSGSGVQPHNFPKGTAKALGQEKATPDDMGVLWDVLKTANRDRIQAQYGGVMEALSNGLRGAIVARPGRQLYVADYAAIEARVLLWLAEDDAALDVFRNHQDIYCDMASAIYKRPINKTDHPTERQLGKAAVLGCFGAETPVLTSRGWTPIVDVRASDLLWDGQEWVAHDGVIAQGTQSTWLWNNIRITPDHKIWTGTNWLPVASLVRPENALFLKSALASAVLPSGGLTGVFGAGFPQSRPSVTVDGRASLISQISERAQRHSVTTALDRRLERPAQKSAGTLMLWLIACIGADSSTASVQPINAATTPRQQPLMTMADEGFALNGLTRLTGVRHFWRIWSRYLGGILPSWKSTALTTTAITRSEISVSPLEANRCLTNVVPVFDILNAGPRHRFTVWTAAGPLIASNCGYQMGGSKFVATAASYGVTIEEDFAIKVVEAYRTKYWRVKQLWYDQEAAAIGAVQSRNPVTCGRVRWIYRNIRGRMPFLFCELPSGRRLAYPEPRIKATMMPWGKQKDVLSYMGVDGYTHQWKRQTVYGGLIVENEVQALARDLLAHAMLLLEESGRYPLVLSVHDESICEVVDGEGSLEEFTALMTQTPEWADGLPIEVESWKGIRYRK